MGRRRRRIVKLQKKKLPKIFLCPACGEVSISISVFREKNLAKVQCGKCSIIEDFSLSIGEEPIDIYCKFTDKVYSGRLSSE